MQKYGWNTDKIQGIIKEYEHVMDTWNLTEETMNEIESRISTYQLLLITSIMNDGETTIIKEIRNRGLLDYLRTETDSHFYQDTFFGKAETEISNSISKLDILPKIKLQKLNLSEQEMMDIITEFIILTFGNDHYQTFKKTLLDNPERIRIGAEDEIPATYAVKENNEVAFYVAIPRKNNILDLVYIAHEVGHIYRMMHTKGSLIDTQNEIISEIESLFYQLSFLDYLIKKGIMVEEANKAKIQFFKETEMIGNIINANNVYRFDRMFFLGEFKKIAKQINLYEKAYQKDCYDLLQWFISIFTEMQFKYTYSSVAAIDLLISDPDIRNKKYQYLLENIGLLESDIIVQSIFNDPIGFNDLKTYKKYREETLSHTR